MIRLTTALFALTTLGTPALADENVVASCLFEGAATQVDTPSALDSTVTGGTTLDGITIDSRNIGGQDIEQSTLGGPNAVSISVPRITFPRIGTPTSEMPNIALPSFQMPGATLRQSDRYTVFALGADILFDFDQASLRPQATTSITKIAQAIAQNCAGLPVTVHGHTDALGSTSYNLALSQARAASVQAALATSLGLPISDIGLVGHGEADPVAANTNADGSDNPEGRQLNRRVEIWIDRHDG